MRTFGIACLLTSCFLFAGLPAGPVGLISNAMAQGGGSYDAAGSYGSGGGDASAIRFSPSSHPRLAPEVSLNYITITGSAVVRVEPEELRVVMAVMNEAESSNECQDLNQATCAAVRAAWITLGVKDDNIVEDFISMLPRYEWSFEEKFGRQVAVQKLVGYRIQTNLHVAVKNETEALKAVNLAFKQGVNDIVTFDYWSSKTDAAKREARKKALQAAKEKSETLLAVFADPPPMINVLEETSVHNPQQLYQTFENKLAENYRGSWNSNIPQIWAYSPKQSFFKGLESNVDVQADGLPMRPAIVVASEVQLYYQSPATKSIPIQR
jgi:uncharacterized protein YggE